MKEALFLVSLSLKSRDGGQNYIFRIMECNDTIGVLDWMIGILLSVKEAYFRPSGSSGRQHYNRCQMFAGW
jgi:hypothetical protein